MRREHRQCSAEAFRLTQHAPPQQHHDRQRLAAQLMYATCIHQALLLSVCSCMPLHDVQQNCRKFDSHFRASHWAPQWWRCSSDSGVASAADSVVHHPSSVGCSSAFTLLRRNPPAVTWCKYSVHWGDCISGLWCETRCPPSLMVDQTLRHAPHCHVWLYQCLGWDAKSGSYDVAAAELQCSPSMSSASVSSRLFRMLSAWRGTAGVAAFAVCTMRSSCPSRKGAPCIGTASLTAIQHLFGLRKLSLD